MHYLAIIQLARSVFSINPVARFTTWEEAHAEARSRILLRHLLPLTLPSTPYSAAPCLILAACLSRAFRRLWALQQQ